MIDTKIEAAKKRAEALVLLQEAFALDGMKPALVIHELRNLESVPYVMWHNKPSALSPFDVEPHLEEEFEPERGESLTIMSISLEELSGNVGNQMIKNEG